MKRAAPLPEALRGIPFPQRLSRALQMNRYATVV